MQPFLIALFVIMTLMLLVVASVSPRQATLSMYELERRRRKGDVSASDELRRMLLLDDIVSLHKAVEALFLALVVLAAVRAFGFLAGVVVSAVLALTYSRIAHCEWLAQMVDNYYQRIEPRLLIFVEKHPRWGQLLRSVSAPAEPNRLNSREELEHLVQQSANVLSSAEKRTISAALHFSEKTVEEVMTPRGVIDTVAKSDVIGPLLLDDLHKTGHSRFPVTDGDIDHIVGILHIRSLLTLDHGKKTSRVEKAMDKKIYFIDQDQKLERALSAFIKTRHHMFIVVNGYRETAGILTLEDTLEALLGRKILDEFDVVDDLRALAARNLHKNNKSSSATDIK